MRARMAGMLLGVLTIGVLAQASPTPPVLKTLEQRVQHELSMLPYYNVFDYLAFQVEGSQVTLMGDVTWPVLRSDAENVTKRIPGVTAVKNDIKVLPLSSFDNRIRMAEYRAVFSQSGMYRYAMGAIPSIHIIVDNGNVTLVGSVSSQMDRNLASLAANQVPGVFSVKNELRID
jgi:hyperosmotically inducible periplasmic protein